MQLFKVCPIKSYRLYYVMQSNFDVISGESNASIVFKFDDKEIRSLNLMHTAFSLFNGLALTLIGMIAIITFTHKGVEISQTMRARNQM